MIFKLNLQRFAEEGAAAAPEAASAETAPAAESAVENVTVTAGDTLADGQTVSSQVAAEMNRQMAKHPELKKVYGQSLRQRGQVQQAAPAETQAPSEKSIEERWNEVRSGEFAELYGRDVQRAIQDRFKNQADNSEQLRKLEPMLKVLRERAGVASNEELSSKILDDDSLYEEQANAKGMTIPAYKEFMQLQEQVQEAQKREQESIRDRQLREHFESLSKQAEEMKKSFPDFNLQKELQNPVFLRMTSPEGKISVEDAYYAIHHKELGPQMMAYGMERAKQQMGQTLQAQRRRPAEGAMKSKGNSAADFNLDPRSLSRQERNKLYDLIHKGKVKIG